MSSIWPWILYSVHRERKVSRDSGGDNDDLARSSICQGKRLGVVPVVVNRANEEVLIGAGSGSLNTDA